MPSPARRAQGFACRPHPLLAPLPPPPPLLGCVCERAQVRWQKWHIRVGFNAREGLVLHNVGWEEGGRVRPILYRASLAEMVVPYGDPK